MKNSKASGSGVETIVVVVGAIALVLLGAIYFIKKSDNANPNMTEATDDQNTADTTMPASADEQNITLAPADKSTQSTPDFVTETTDSVL